MYTSDTSLPLAGTLDRAHPQSFADLFDGPEHEQQRRTIEEALFGVAEPVYVDGYRLLHRLGEGGMGTIFAAIDERRERSDAGVRDVAVKLMRAGICSDRRCEREIAILSRLRHPSIVRYLDHGTTASGRVYLVTERLDGEDLCDHLHRHQPTVSACIDLGIGVAQGLQAAHDIGFVHRDIKPSNLFLVDGRMDRVKILDFGIARADEAMPAVTATGAVLGTIGYMAPEQALGEAGLDHRADIFSLGCVLYEAIAGKPPFLGHTAVETLSMIHLHEPPSLRSLQPEVSPRLEQLIHAMLAKRPDQRPASAAAAIETLRACAAEMGFTPAEPPVLGLRPACGLASRSTG